MLALLPFAPILSNFALFAGVMDTYMDTIEMNFEIAPHCFYGREGSLKSSPERVQITIATGCESTLCHLKVENVLKWMGMAV